MPGLATPTTTLHAEWLEAHAEWGPGLHEDGFGLWESDDTVSQAGFSKWVKRLLDQADPAKAGAMGRVPCTYRWIVENSDVLGGITLRHELRDHLLVLGHIGYGVRPSARKRGLATWALGRMLDEARTLHLTRVLLVCSDDNVASVNTIKRHGGVLDDKQDTEHGTVRRYWIAL